MRLLLRNAPLGNTIVQLKNMIDEFRFPCIQMPLTTWVEIFQKYLEYLHLHVVGQQSEPH